MFVYTIFPYSKMRGNSLKEGGGWNAGRLWRWTDVFEFLR